MVPQVTVAMKLRRTPLGPLWCHVDGCWVVVVVVSVIVVGFGL